MTNANKLRYEKAMFHVEQMSLEEKQDLFDQLEEMILLEASNSLQLNTLETPIGSPN